MHDPLKLIHKHLWCIDHVISGFHYHLVKMIPTQRCAPRPMQLYLILELVRWNARQEAKQVEGGKGKVLAVYEPSLLDHANQLAEGFNHGKVEPNFRKPAVPGEGDEEELVGLAYLFRQTDPTFNTCSHAQAVAELVEEVPADNSQEDLPGNCTYIIIHIFICLL